MTLISLQDLPYLRRGLHRILLQYTQVYWLNLDLLKVARAALRCSAPFTAMLYVEYWCKAKYKRLTLQDVDMLSQVTSCKHSSHVSFPNPTLNCLCLMRFVLNRRNVPLEAISGI